MNKMLYVENLIKKPSYGSNGYGSNGYGSNGYNNSGYGGSNDAGSGSEPVVIYVQRFSSGPRYTASSFYANSNFGSINGYLLEPGGPSTVLSQQDQRIPAGTYQLHENIIKKGMYELYNEQVSIDRHIKIHAGNSGSDTEGCLLPGSSYNSNGTVFGSVSEYASIMSFILLNGGATNVNIVIVDMP